MRPFRHIDHKYLIGANFSPVKYMLPVRLLMLLLLPLTVWSAQHIDHSTFFADSLADGPAVTRACLECHPESANQVMHTAHWNWVGDPVAIPGQAEETRIGKRNLINNFCIGVTSNWPRCTVCHVGYGWEDDSFDFSNHEAVDCLVCHDHSGQYAKGLAGRPAEGVDLVAAAKSVGNPTRDNCGSCHFTGGGGNAVKHGDLDQSLLHPSRRLDVHMGGLDFSCVDCHKTSEHMIPGRSISVSIDDANRLRCTDCHDAEPHRDQRLNAHQRAVACQTCHIPYMAVDEATKMTWDWSTAGDKGLEKSIADKHKYMAIKGSFTYEQRLEPTYHWYNGEAEHYIVGEVINPAEETIIAGPLGDVTDDRAKIWPFKLHRGNQIYDTEHNWFIVPKTYGPGGFWTEFDWDKAARLGCEETGLPYSGSYDFATSVMYWPLSHMVAPAENALSCSECHGDTGRLEWEELGYPGDPIYFGNRTSLGLVKEASHE